MDEFRVNVLFDVDCVDLNDAQQEPQMTFAASSARIAGRAERLVWKSSFPGFIRGLQSFEIDVIFRVNGKPACSNLRAVL